MLLGQGLLKLHEYPRDPRAIDLLDEQQIASRSSHLADRQALYALIRKIVALVLERKEVKGSTGTIRIREGKIEFIKNGQEAPSVSRDMVYKK